MAYTIKRYTNRKLYDPQASRYVALEDLAALIRRGEELRVVDASSGEDVTAVILAQIILDQERAGATGPPAAVLQQLIKHGEAWRTFLQQAFSASLEGVVSSQRELDRVFREWAARTGFVPPAPPAPTPPRAGREARPRPSADDLGAEIAALKRQMGALERRLRRRRRARKR